MERLAVKIIATLLAALLCAAGGGWAGFKVSESHHLDTITAQRAELAELKAAKTLADDLAEREAAYCGALDKAVARQDAVIAELGRLTEAHKAAALAAAASARAESSRRQAEAAAVLASRPPAGADACASARTAFDEELRAERAGDAP